MCSGGSPSRACWIGAGNSRFNCRSLFAFFALVVHGSCCVEVSAVVSDSRVSVVGPSNQTATVDFPPVHSIRAPIDVVSHHVRRFRSCPLEIHYMDWCRLDNECISLLGYLFLASCYGDRKRI